MPKKYDDWPRAIPEDPFKNVPRAKNQKKRIYAKKLERPEWWMDNGHKYGRPGYGNAHPKQKPALGDRQVAKYFKQVNKNYRKWKRQSRLEA